MKKTILLLTLSMFLTLSFAQNITDVKGWRTSEWGMSIDTVRQLFSSEITIYPKPNNCGGSCYNPFGISKYEISGYPFEVDFLFGVNDYKLYQINIAFRKAGSHWESLFSTLETVLIEKYGSPTIKTENPRKYSWNYPSTKIELNHVYIEGVMSSVVLRYYKPNDTDKSKL